MWLQLVTLTLANLKLEHARGLWPRAPSAQTVRVMDNLILLVPSPSRNRSHYYFQGGRPGTESHPKFLEDTIVLCTGWFYS